MIYENIPSELKNFAQWCLCSTSKAPRVELAGKLYYAKTTDCDTWRDWETVSKAAIKRNCGLGFVLTKDDDYVVIDLDVCNEASQIRKGEEINSDKWTTPEELALYDKIVLILNSYTEKSLSGDGYHIWVKSSTLKETRQFGNIQIYAHSRFIIMTDTCVTDMTTIEYRDDELAEVFSLLGADMSEIIEHKPMLPTLNTPITSEDDDIVSQICGSKTGKRLWDGEINHSSQSESDMSLIRMICDYTTNYEQVKRIFLNSGLANREKAKRPDYIQRTYNKVIMLMAQANDGVEEFMRNFVTKKDKPIKTMPIEPAMTKPIGSIDFPPGLVGKICKYVYDTAPRPVKEVAIVAGLGLFAGICGMSYGFPGTGTNLYILLIAKSGVGKEAMLSGISKIQYQLNAMDFGDPSFNSECQKFVNFAAFASGPALIKAVLNQRSFVNVVGELGKTIAEMAGSNPGSAKSSLRTAITDLYAKSSKDSLVGGISYSDADKTTGQVHGAAYSIVGESTPNTFYDCLTPSMLEDGFLSRFIVLEYYGNRPELNYNIGQKLQDDVLNDLYLLCKHSLLLLARSKTVEIKLSEYAKKRYSAFEKECTRQLNETDNDALRQSWNRADIKVLRISGILASADNHLNPVVEAHHIDWAISLVEHDVQNMLRRIASGDVGFDDNSRQSKLMHVLKEYASKRQLDKPYYKPDPRLRAIGIVEKSYLYKCISQFACFNKHKLGTKAALDLTIDSFCQYGWLHEVPKAWLREKYEKRCQAYQVTLPD